jgi:hypothetical protein
MTQKLDKEHLEEIRQLQQQFADTATFLGNIAIEKHIATRQVEQLESREKEVMAQFEQLREDEQTLLSRLKERYGDGEIDINSGTFTAVGQ